MTTTVQDPKKTAAETPREEASDEELVLRHLDGDERSFHELANRYQERLARFVNRKIGDRDRAEDLVQEAFVRVYRHLHRFDPSKKFSTWIYTIAGNLAKNELRNRSRNPMVLFQRLTKNREQDDRPLQWEDETYAPDDLARKRELRATVEEAVEELPEHHRKVFELREMEGKSYQEIADITDLKLGTVKSRLSRARSRFAEIVRGKMEGSDEDSDDGSYDQAA